MQDKPVARSVSQKRGALVRSRHSALCILHCAFCILPTAFRLLPTAICLLLFAYCLLPTANAQTTGGVKGKVRALNGQGIAGATIIARQNGEDKKSVKTGDKGEFVLVGIEPGVYNFVFDAKGYASGVRFNVTVKKGQIKDLGDRLILSVDQGTMVIVHGSVFFKDGRSVPGAKVEYSRVRSDGSLQKIGDTITNYTGEFGFRQREGAAKIRITAKYKDATASKDLDVNSAAIYNVAISLDVLRDDK